MPHKKKGQFKEVDSRVDSDALEARILKYWEDEKIFEESLARNKNNPLFTFYDGPPYATGKPHYGHILQSAIKDTVLRYKTMQGYYVPRRVGWDCHGLPIENIVEKELGIKEKKEIEADIEGFNRQCRQTVHRYVDEFTGTLKRIGRWADYNNAYSTLDRDYMESEWWAFRQLWDQDLIYKAFRTTPYCIRCATPLSNFEVSSNYKDKIDQAVYVLFEVEGRDNLFLLAWTTTPWTLPGNAAVAFNPDIKYVSVEYEGKNIILAAERVAGVFGNAAAGKEWDSSELTQLKYQPLYQISGAEGQKNIHTLVAADFVTAQDGSGLVHIAPAFGEEDSQLGKAAGLPVLRTVDQLGNFTAEAGAWAGKNIFSANKEIIRDLKDRQLLMKQENYKHSYPFCWRCDTPLIYYALDTWFVKITDIKERMLKNNQQIHWVPSHVKEGRFAKGIESAPDWAVSRNRFWSTPVPIWECGKCTHRVCIGSIAELQELSGASDKAVADIHRPYVDEITWACDKCDGQMRRISEVLDVWFDSASMPYSQWHYPFANKELVEKGYPADFIAESIEMTRAWFYVLHILATALTTKDIGLGIDQPAYKNVIASGLIFAEDGQKLSKKLKNYPEIEPTLKRFGADILRFYLLSSTSLGEPYRFSEKDLRQAHRNVYMTLWNVYSFFVRYANTRHWQPAAGKQSDHVLDKWILARMKQLNKEVRSLADSFDIDAAAREFVGFIDELSNWYVRRSRQRFQPSAVSDSEAKDNAYATLYQVLVELSKTMAPFLPFVSEEIYQNLTGARSVHLEKLEEAAELTAVEKKIVTKMAKVREIVSQGLAARAKAGIKVRQPLGKLIIKTATELDQAYIEMIKEEVNVDEAAIEVSGQTDAGLSVELDTAITPELAARGTAREIIRHGQLFRRQAGYELNDRIILTAVPSDSQLAAALTAHSDEIKSALQADEIISVPAGEDAGGDITVNGSKIYLGVKKA